MEQEAILPINKTYMGYDISAERRREKRQEIDYCNAIAELKTSINFARDQSPLRRDGESINYILERVWSTHCHLLTPEINFEEKEIDA